MDGKQFRVGPVDYTVEMVDGLDSRYNLFGQVEYVAARIEIAEGMPETRVNDTLIHELLHAMLHEAGYDEQDEQLVRRLGSVLTQVLRDNDFGFIRGKDSE